MHTIENTLFLGRHIEHLATVKSTNEYALNLLSKSKPPEGTVISAYEQTHGRGQIGSLWESEPGHNLTFSIIFYPSFLPVAKQFALTQCLSLGIVDALKHFIPRGLSLKWPNDIYVDNKKIGGMLLQNSISHTKMIHTIAGIGINVNQKLFHSEAPNPVSLWQVIGKETSLSALLTALCVGIERRYLFLRSGNFSTIKKDYLENLYLFMKDSLFKRPNGSLFSGRIVDVLPDGKLVIIHDKGEEVFAMKEIIFIND